VTFVRLTNLQVFLEQTWDNSKGYLVDFAAVLTVLPEKLRADRLFMQFDRAAHTFGFLYY